MSHKAQQVFCKKVKSLYPQFFKRVNVIDVGSLDINGGNRGLFSNSYYVGVDILDGKNVDVVGNAHEVLPELKPKIEPSYVWSQRKSGIEQDGRFNTIISTEVLEHDRHYEQTLLAMYHKLKPGGLLMITCGGDGRPEHGTEENTPEASPMTTSYYMNISNKILSDILPPFGFIIYHLAQVESDLQFYGVKVR